MFGTSALFVVLAAGLFFWPLAALFVALGPAGVIAAIVAVEAAVWWKSRAPGNAASSQRR